MHNINFTSDVFIPGGMPKVTYVSRNDLGIEKRIQRWSLKRNKPLLSVSGPTKSGKTVLLKKYLTDAAWLSGGAIQSADDFWNTICEEYDIYHGRALSVESSAHAGINVTGTAGVVSAQGSHTQQGTRTIERSLSSTPINAARKWITRSLNSNHSLIIVIDDFHYIPTNEQVKIIQGIKDLIFLGLGVAVLSVPHRAFDIERAETEMTGRVERIQVDLWNKDDLSQIATKGFTALNIASDTTTINRLAEESFGSPHLMQTHCLNACTENNIEETSDSPQILKIHKWEDFFRNTSASTSRSAYELLKRGPRVRTDRIERTLKNDKITDIYGAILYAIEHTGPKLELSYEEIRSALRDSLKSDQPQRHEITNVLDQMTKIAKEKIEGEPVLEYDTEYSTLHIVDPFFAYYLRWGIKQF